MNKLTPRLQTIYNLVPKSDCIIEIGCDHCFLSIELIKQGKTKSVIALDINQEPLENCKKNIAYSGVKNIRPLLSNGFENIHDIFDSVIISGMGSKLIIDILKQRNDLKNKSLILQPQTGEVILRKWLRDNSFKIQDEKIIKDGGIIYTIFLITNKGKYITTNIDLFIGPILNNFKDELLIEKYTSRLNHLNQFVDSIKDTNKKQKIQLEIITIKNYLQE